MIHTANAWACVFVLPVCADGEQRCSEAGCDAYVCECVRARTYGLVDCSLTPGISSGNPHTTSYSRTSPMQITF